MAEIVAQNEATKQINVDALCLAFLAHHIDYNADITKTAENLCALFQAMPKLTFMLDGKGTYKSARLASERAGESLLDRTPQHPSIAIKARASIAILREMCVGIPNVVVTALEADGCVLGNNITAISPDGDIALLMGLFDTANAIIFRPHPRQSAQYFTVSSASVKTDLLRMFPDFVDVSPMLLVILAFVTLSCDAGNGIPADTKFVVQKATPKITFAGAEKLCAVLSLLLYGFCRTEQELQKLLPEWTHPAISLLLKRKQILKASSAPKPQDIVGIVNALVYPISDAVNSAALSHYLQTIVETLYKENDAIYLISVNLGDTSVFGLLERMKRMKLSTKNRNELVKYVHELYANDAAAVENIVATFDTAKDIATQLKDIRANIVPSHTKLSCEFFAFLQMTGMSSVILCSRPNCTFSSCCFYHYSKPCVFDK